MDLLGASERGEREHSGVPYLNGGGRVNTVCPCPLRLSLPLLRAEGGGEAKALLELSIGGTTPRGDGGEGN